MKVVLSKKGFDSSFGRYPSVIDGECLISVPIPCSGDPYKYSELKLSSGAGLFDAVKSYYKNVYEKTAKKEFNGELNCHPDPNLSNYFAEENFVGSFGQEGTAQAHLEKHGVETGDLFVFFGWFNAVQDGAFVKGNGKHTMFGYLQIAEKIYPQRLQPNEINDYEIKYPWLKKQPHWNFDGKYKENNCIYVAANLCSFDTALKGNGTFTYSPELDLTKPNANAPREWHIPALAELAVSQPKGSKFNTDGTFTLPPTFGQEYIIEESDKATTWAESLIKNYAKRK